MRTALLRIAILSLTAPAVFAQTLPDASIPEPGIWALIGIGAAAFLIGRRNKKK
jgi:hypothetical protein